MGDMFNDLFSEEPDDSVEDYVEESTDANGNHVTKEVHKGKGFQTVTIKSDGAGSISGGSIGDILGSGFPPEMAALMGMPPGFGPTVTMSSGGIISQPTMKTTIKIKGGPIQGSASHDSSADDGLDDVMDMIN